MEWNAQLDWAEEVFALMVVLPPVLLAVALLWWIAPRLGAPPRR
jgi:hypothetical protein